MVLCMGAFLGAAAALTLVGGAGITSLVIAATAGAAWLVLGLRGFRAVDDTAWGRRVFRFSLVVVVALSVSIGVGGILP
jgi:protoheme IX farnesyltransferase